MLAGGATTRSSVPMARRPHRERAVPLEAAMAWSGRRRRLGGQRRRCGFGRARLSLTCAGGAAAGPVLRPSGSAAAAGDDASDAPAPVAARPPPASSRATSSRALAARSRCRDSLARAIGWSPLRWHAPVAHFARHALGSLGTLSSIRRVESPFQHRNSAAPAGCQLPAAPSASARSACLLGPLTISSEF